MAPVEGRVVVEGEQSLFVAGYLGNGLGPLHPELLGERLDGSLGVGLVLGTGDLLDGHLRPTVNTPGQRVENVHGLMHHPDAIGELRATMVIPFVSTAKPYEPRAQREAT